MSPSFLIALGTTPRKLAKMPRMVKCMFSYVNSIVRYNKEEILLKHLNSLLSENLRLHAEEEGSSKDAEDRSTDAAPAAIEAFRESLSVSLT